MPPERLFKGGAELSQNRNITALVTTDNISEKILGTIKVFAPSLFCCLMWG